MENSYDVIFPKLGIYLEEINSVAFRIFGMPIYWYGVIIGSAFLIGIMIALKRAKNVNFNQEKLMDCVMVSIIFAIIGARLYYVIPSWESYIDNPIKIFATREGGLAIFGGIIGAFIASLIYCKRHKLDFLKLIDIAAPSIVLGQAIGRWGNFFNKEAFGGYTDNIFSMMILKSKAAYIPDSVLNHIIIYNNNEYIQVHPTFLYESMWNIGVFIFLSFIYNKRKFDGEVFLLYLLGYSLGRVWIEGLRTDQLLLFNTNIPISQALSLVLIVISTTLIAYKRFYKKV